MRRADFLFALALAATASAAEPAERTLRDLAYGPHPERNLLDLYLPAPGSPAPIIVWLHSGGWYSGGRGNGGPARAWVRRGYAVAAVAYRFSSDAVFPAQIEDCQRAIRWLRAHAKQHGLDPARIGVWGYSAGGHLAALLATAPEAFPAPPDDPHRAVSPAVAAACAQAAPTDLAAWDRQALPEANVIANAPDSMVARLLGATPAAAPAAAARASAVTHLSRATAPVFLVHGDRDRAVPPAQSVAFHAELRAAGVESVLHLVPGGGHADETFTRGLPLEAIAAFFDRHLRPAK
ncbi:MAG: alpha/beta hydrolase [Opitutaceae bacterium]|nr:alpha/beta hydrolase [Opitutaceae bacterium]